MLEWKKDGWKAVIALAPMLIILGVFTFYPIINTFIISFFPSYDYQTGVFGEFGFDSYIKVLEDAKFWTSIGMTALMVVISVPLSIIISLLLSVALCSIKKLQGIFQTIFFLPYVTNGIAFGLVFATIFSPTDTGLINIILSWFNIDPVSWTGQTAYIPVWAGLTVITVYSVWNGLAFKILVFVGGIQGIDKQYYQAAQIDGASKFRVFRKITLPLLSPMVLYITITSLIGAFKAYSSVVALFGETMGNGSEGTFMTAVGYIYEFFTVVTAGGSKNNLSIAAAAAVVLFVFILIVTGLQMVYNKKRVHY